MARPLQKICKLLLNREVPCDEVLTEVKSAVLKLQDKIPVFKLNEVRWVACLQQYTLINMPGSVVAISKVTHTRREAFFGLKARRDIQVGSYIKETCSSMSLDRVGEQGPSIIEATSSQIPPSVPRLILGPFHFVNHDCEPNSQPTNDDSYKDIAIANTHAFAILAIKNIPRG
ncbi:hypothetical protein BJV77DRAFT_963544 [Russula vinacea]|nr:hypothetical protein BJV77DRAFT_963544 [Russula vinacea]